MNCGACGEETERVWKTNTCYVWLCGACGWASVPEFPQRTRIDEPQAGAALPGFGTLIPGTGQGR
jgi:hypothetical protein